MVRNGGEDEYRKMLERYRTSDMADEKRRAMVALGSSPVPELQLETLAWVLQSGEVRAQDMTFPISAVARAKGGALRVWQNFCDNFDRLQKDFSQGQSFVVSRLVGASVSSLPTLEDMAVAEAFFVDHPVPSAVRTIRQSLEAARSGLERRERDLPALRAFVKAGFTM